MQLGKYAAFSICGVALLSASSMWIEASAVGITDPYAALKLYEGKWDSTTTTGEMESIRIENHCAQTGRFFVCEQGVDGKTVGLVVFLPVAQATNGGEEYKTTGLSPDDGSSGGWNKMTIEGDRWTYSWEHTNDAGKKILWRNVNHFFGTAKIHFEIQRSEDGKEWKTVKGGDEIRVQ